MSRIVSRTYSNHSSLQRGKGVRASSARAVGAFVPQITKKSFQKFGFSTASLLTDWATIVGQEVAALTQPERLKWPKLARPHDQEGAAEDAGRGATLTIRVDPAHVLDVQYQHKQIKERLNSYFGYAAVSNLRWIQVPLGQMTSTPCQLAGKENSSSGQQLARDGRGAPSSPSAPADCDQAHTLTTDTSDRLALALARLAENVRGQSISTLPVAKELNTL